MPPTTAPAPRAGSLLPGFQLPAGARSAVRGAARAVVATVGAVLAGLMLSLPAAHLPFAAPSGLQITAASSADHRAAGAATGLLPGVGPAVRAVVQPVALGTPAAVQALLAPVAALAVDPAPGAPWVLLTAALVGVPRPSGRRRVPARPPHLGPAPLRGPPAGLAPAP